MEVQAKNSDTAIHVHWNWTIKQVEVRRGVIALTAGASINRKPEEGMGVTNVVI